jgi:hypothetical protein
VCHHAQPRCPSFRAFITPILRLLSHYLLITSSVHHLSVSPLSEGPSVDQCWAEGWCFLNICWMKECAKTRIWSWITSGCGSVSKLFWAFSAACTTL